MKKVTITTTALIIVIFAAGIIYFFIDRKHAQAPTQPTNQSQNQTPPAHQQPQNANIQVTAPTPNQQITSPLVVTGQAKGPWYFEASFPIKLLDGNGNTIAQTTGHAQADWMTTNFVPFSATLTFTTPSTSTGTLILEKDNPSGEPQNADSISIPVQF